MPRQQTAEIPTIRPQSAEMWAWCVVLVVVAYWADVIRTSQAPYPLAPAAIVQSVRDAGAFTVAAWAMILTRAGRLVAPGPASRRLILAVLGVGLVCAIPARQTATLALAAAGGGLLLRPHVTAGGRQAGQLMLALGAAMVWTSLYANPLHIAVAGLDARVVATLLRLLGMDAVADGNLVIRGDFDIEVLTACTSSVQLAEIGLAFLVIVLYRRGAWRGADLPWLGASLLASVVLTEIRLSFMAVSEPNYRWWHDGPGVTVYGLVALAMAAAFPLLAAARDRDALASGHPA